MWVSSTCTKITFTLLAKLIATSEHNSYGIVDEKWFDGEVKFPSINFFPDNYCRDYKELNIVGVIDYLNLDTLCTHESYYECLAERFVRLDLNRIDDYKNGSEHTNESLCSPFSLPFNKEEIPYCKTEDDRSYFENIILGLNDSQEEHCKKSCLVKEYQTKAFDRKDNLFGFDFHFGRHTKTVKKEYLITSEMTLVGNVGGMLGLFVGFSFLGTTEFLMDFIVLKLWTWMKNKLQTLEEDSKSAPPLKQDQK